MRFSIVVLSQDIFVLGKIFKILIEKMFIYLLQRRLQKELMSLMKEPPPGVTVDGDQASQNLTL